jgi:hypothetical protein
LDTSVEDHVIYQVANTALREHPYAHFFVDSVFPPEFYSALRRNWPSASQLVSLGSTGRVPSTAYPERFVMPLTRESVETFPAEKRAFWQDLGDWMLGSTRFRDAVMYRFERQLRDRFGAALEDTDFTHEVLVVRDHTNYALGPHTDAPHKAISLLFYCPDDEAYTHLGTAIYRPVDPAFRCVGGPHYPFERFRKVATMPFKPNALFAFVKTDNSFHGVDPIKDADVLRDLILYDIRVMAAIRDEENPETAMRETAHAAPRKRETLGLGARMLKNILRRGR